MSLEGGMASLSSLENSLRETLRKEAADPAKQQRALEIQKEAWGKHVKQAPLTMPAELTSAPEPAGAGERKEEVRTTESMLRAREEEIKKRKAEVEQRVKAQSERVSLEAKKLEELKKELDTIEDPTKKEVAELRKKIEVVDRELRPMKALCERKEKELKDAMAAFNDKNAQKTELVGRLFELVTESEKMRLAKLEELNRLLRDMEARSNGGTY